MMARSRCWRIGPVPFVVGLLLAVGVWLPATAQDKEKPDKEKPDKEKPARVAVKWEYKMVPTAFTRPPAGGGGGGARS